MRHSLLGVGGGILIAILLAACHGGDALTVPAATSNVTPATVSIRVMTFNIEWGGTHVSFDNVIAAIRKADPDIVGIQEAEGNLERLAAALGWHFDLRNYVVSRFPLLDLPIAGGKYALAEVRPGYVVAIANVHLPSDPYGPDLVRDGATLDDVLENENVVRLPALRPFLDVLATPVSRGFPVFVTGDFNSPTHADWTNEMVGRRPFLDFAVPWPVSQALARAGFTDAWRAIHPDVEAHPGLTWWAGRPPLAAYAPDDGDPMDRIDQIWFAGPVEPVAALIVGEPGGPEVTISVSPWPSDHRGVVADFRVAPVRRPPFLTTNRHVYREGANVLVSYALNGRPAAGIAVIDLRTERVVLRRRLPASDGRIELAPLPPGRYRVVPTTDGPALQRDFWVLGRAAEPAVEPERAAFHAGEAIRIRWRDAPGNRNDYVAIYAADAASDPEVMLAYAYVDARPEGAMLLDDFVTYDSWSPAPGRYLLRLMKDDGYEVLAESELFVIR